MEEISVAHRAPAFVSVLAGGLVAGTLDITYACVFWALRAGTPPQRIFQSVAKGVLGPSTFKGGAATAALGLFLHYFIAFSAAAIYCLSSRKLPFLKDHFIVCGMFYGIAVFLVMNLVVLPLCAFHFMGPYQLRGMIQGLLMHMLIIGLPISFSLNKLSD